MGKKELFILKLPRGKNWEFKLPNADLGIIVNIYRNKEKKNK